MADLEGFFSSFDAPVIVVTAEGDRNERSGCLVGFASQGSIHPPRFLVCLSVVKHTFAVARRAEALGVHILGIEQMAVAELFGEDTGDVVDKLAQVEWRRGRMQTPLLVDCAAWLEGLILDRIPLGDHLGFLLEPLDGGIGPRQGCLRRSEVSGLTAGHPADEVQ